MQPTLTHGLAVSDSGLCDQGERFLRTDVASWRARRKEIQAVAFWTRVILSAVGDPGKNPATTISLQLDINIDKRKYSRQGNSRPPRVIGVLLD
ncbi:hypothetical protein ACLKA7_007797 [Drosophila subpalustris]